MVEVLPPPAAVEVRPPDLATLVFTVANHGTLPDSYQFKVALPEGFQLLGSLPAITLGPAEQKPIFLTVSVPSGTAAGQIPITLKAISQTDPTVTASATGFLAVPSVFGIEIFPPDEQVVDLGETVKLLFKVINQGNTIDRLVFTAASRQGFPIRLQFEEFEILPGEERDLQLMVTIPQDAMPGQERVTLTALLTRSGSESSATAQLTILPPLPQAVGGTISLEVPTTLALSLSKAASSPINLVESLGGNATFAQTSRIDYQIQLANLLRLQTVRFNLERPRFAITLGDLSLHFSELVQLSGRGARLTTRPGPLGAQITVAAAQAGQRFRAGVQLALDPRPKTTLALQSLFGTGAGGPQFLGSISLDEQELKFAQLFAELAFSHANRRGDLEMLLRLTSEIAGQIIRAELRRTGDQAGITLKQSFNLGDAFFQNRFSLMHINVGRGPAVVDTQISAANRLPLAPLPTISAQIDFHSQVNPIPPVLTNLRDFQTELLLTQRVGPLTLAGAFQFTRTQDFVAGTDLGQTLWRATADLRIGPLLTLLRLELITQRDLLSGAVENRFLGTLVREQLQFGQVGLSISVERLPKLTSLSAQLRASLSRFTLTSTAALNITDLGELSPTLGLFVALRFGLPIPFIRTKSRVEGFIFVDENANGKRDPGECGVPKVILSLAGLLARSNEAGFFRFPPVQSGSFRLDIQNLSPKFVPTIPLPLSIKLQTGQIRQVEIPLKEIGIISGLVFNDLNKNGTVDLGEGGIAGVKILLLGPLAQETRTGPDGRFSFQVQPGSSTIEVDETTLPRRFKLTTSNKISVTVAAGEVQFVRFGAVEFLPIEFAPIADFTFQPEKPKPGELITFDGSASEDIDGQIVAYEWDFDADGIVDATGVIVTHSFPSSGSFPVTLTVTDNDGNKNSASQTVLVEMK